ncbi:hypothetical protein LOTGIDRAFT_162446 [Lottia gigantea]|uniref:Uncharacterized protein n=1 Tax=Lottia gigantea TaxID=225164 RepID=V4ABT0_LOTGI|nr:hypothetical protein LOTGIDRAFT_162446 [Lottia gigantea]ESO92540.1 hypothetical protein LOTGIDRAFT_162446 [Lottia gigantea]
MTNRVQRDRKQEWLDFNSKQEARYEAMRQSRYSSIVYKQHEELQRRFEKQAQMFERTKNSLQSEIKKIRNRRVEYQDKFTELKKKLNYFGESSSIAESRISTKHHRNSYFRQSLRVKQFLSQYNINNETNGIHIYGDHFPADKLLFLPKICPSDKIQKSKNSESGRDLGTTDTNYGTKSPAVYSQSDSSHISNDTDLFKLECKRNVERYKYRPLEKNSRYLFSVNINDRPAVYGKYIKSVKTYK